MQDVIQRLMTVLSEQDVREMVRGIETAIRRSAIMRPQLTYTEGPMSQHELKRRIAWCCEWVLERKKATRWPTERLADELPQALIDHLDGNDPAEPAKTCMWAGAPEPGTEDKWQ